MEHSPFISGTLVSILIPTEKEQFLPNRCCFEQIQNNKPQKEKEKNYNRNHTVLTFVHKAEIDLFAEPDSVPFQSE